MVTRSFDRHEQTDVDEQQAQLAEQQALEARAHDLALNEQRQAAQQSTEALARAERQRQAEQSGYIEKQGMHENTAQAQAAKALREREAHTAHLATRDGAEQQAAKAKAEMQAAADEVIAAEHAIDLQNDWTVARVLHAHEHLAQMKTIAKACANRAAATK